MKVRRFRFYAKREDLQAILEEFQGNRQILAFSGTTACSWKEYRWRDHEKEGIHHIAGVAGHMVNLLGKRQSSLRRSQRCIMTTKQQRSFLTD